MSTAQNRTAWDAQAIHGTGHACHQLQNSRTKVFMENQRASQALVLVHTLNPSTQQAEQDLHEFKASLVYIASSRPGGLHRDHPHQQKKTPVRHIV